MAWKRFEVVETPDKGRGLVACRRLQFGQLVMRITGQVIDDPSYSSRYCIDLGQGRLLEPDAPGAFLNHSCNPNCELILGNGNKVELRAKMAINTNGSQGVTCNPRAGFRGGIQCDRAYPNTRAAK